MRRLLMLSFLVVGCAHTARVDRTWAPSGAPAFAISCSGTVLNMASCYSAAGEMCGARGYSIVTRDQEVWVESSNVGDNGSSTTTAKRSLVVVCGSDVRG